jgi:regulator of sigma E protease
MEFLAAIPKYGFWLLLLLTILVFVHEMGHYLVARWCGVRVEVFSIGFGPELFGRYDKHGTRWKFSAIPLGGYVKMFGQGANLLEGEAGKALSPEDRAVAFDYKSVWRRMAIVAAGPAANYIFAILIFALIFVTYGKDVAVPVIGEVTANSAAERAGLKSGDKIVALNGSAVESFDQIAEFVRVNLDQDIHIAFERNGTVETTLAKPDIATDVDILGKEMRVGRLGISNAEAGVVVQLGPLDSLAEGTKRVFEVSGVMLKGIWQIVTGVRSTNEIGGVIRTGAIAGQLADAGLWSLVMFSALLSVNLGLVNLFPIPLLDGGHLVYYSIEAVRGRPVGERMQEWGFRFGIAFVLGLMCFAAWNDLVYLNVIDYIRAAFT